MYQEIFPQLTKIPARVVSLVPSVTESLFDLGFGDSVVGITDYCIYPENLLRGIKRVGGPKDVDLQWILDLKPELVFANHEENDRNLIESLMQLGIATWVLTPRSVKESLQFLRKLVSIFQDSTAFLKVRELELSWEIVVSARETHPQLRYFCPIWRDEYQSLVWWMVFNEHTYMNDLLWHFGGINIFANRLRKDSLEADLGLVVGNELSGPGRCFPRVTRTDVRLHNPEIILLPTEPFQFNVEYKQEIEKILPDVCAVREGRLLTIDGTWINWYGTRLAKAIQMIPGLF